MSRAFVKENDLEHAGIDIPERPVSIEPNYVTQTGLTELRDSIKAIEISLDEIKLIDSAESKQIKMKLERDLRYYLKRIESAILIDSKNQDHTKVLFGAKVKLINTDGKEYYFHLVGEDEANLSKNKLSYIAPLAKQLIGSVLGDEFTWMMQGEEQQMYIDEITYN